jgi:hypothetical protein
LTEFAFDFPHVTPSAPSHMAAQRHTSTSDLTFNIYYSFVSSLPYELKYDVLVSIEDR